LQVVVVKNVVGISVTFAAFVCISQCRYHGSINVTQDMWQVARYIVPPELATLKLANCVHKLLEINTPFLFSYLAPVNSLGARLGVATFIVKGASAGAGLTAGGAGRDGASLSVAGDLGESEVHDLGLN
jgi:hypothetical protein